MNKVVTLVLAGFGFTGLACASITVSNPSVGPSLTNSGDFTWSYAITGDGFEQVVAGNYATCQGGTSCGTFFTIYDFQGYVDGSAKSSDPNWSVLVQPVGLTPSNQIVVDDPSVVNLTFTYNGPTTVVPTEDGFTADSTYGLANLGGMFTYQAQKIANPTGSDQGQGPLAVPMAAPEPSYFGLLGSGLVLIGAFRRKLTKGGAKA